MTAANLPPLTTAAVVPLAHVVLVDARAERLGVMRTLLGSSGLVAVMGEASTRIGAIEEVGRSGADVAIVEIQMPVDEGLATVADLRRHFPQLRIVVCSFHQDAVTKGHASESGADAYLGKPIDVAGLETLLRLFLATKREPDDDGRLASGLGIRLEPASLGFG